MDKITKKCQEMSRMHAEIIEAQIAEAISETGCNINDLTAEDQGLWFEAEHATKLICNAHCVACII